MSSRARLSAASSVLILIAVAMSVGVVGASPTKLSKAEPRSVRRVLVVSLPRVTWAELRDVGPRNLMAFMDRAAVASMSTRTVGPRTDGADAYLTIGAGNRADAFDPVSAGWVASVDDVTPSGTAGEVYRRRTGIRPTGEMVALTIAEQIERNSELLYGAVPGSLASALASAGREMAAVGNAGAALVDDRPQREVGLAAMDADGQVASGNVDQTLLVADPAAPFGVRTDPRAMAASVERAWGDADVQVVEMSDLERAEEARAESTPEQGEAQFRDALRRADSMFAELMRGVDPSRDLVIVVGPTAPIAGEQLTVFGVSGPGVERGWARSPTTRRSGFVTLTDIAPTILDGYGIDPPESVNDTPIVAVASTAALRDRIDAMVDHDDRATFRDDVTGPITVAFIVTLVVLLLAVMWAVGRSTRSSRLTRALRWIALAVIATPAMMFLSGLLPYDVMTVVTFGFAIAAGSAAAAVLAWAVGRSDPVGPPVLLCLLAVVVLAVDILSGATLQLNTVFGYSPIVAGRFAGFGNQAFAILTISALVAVSGGWELWRRRWPGSGDGPRLVAAIAVFAAVVVLDGAPFWGSDVGGVLASIPAFAVCVLLLVGVRIRARIVALIGLCTVGVLVLFAAVDLARPVESRTHLGRFAQKLLDGEGALILQRKLDANMSILTSTVWTLVIPMALLFIGYLTWRPNRLLRRLNAERPGFRAFGASGLTLGLLAWAVNDSGVAIPALMLTVALPYTAYLVLGLSDDADAPDDDPGRHDELDRDDEGDRDGPDRIVAATEPM